MNTEWLTETWQYRELFYFLAWRDVKIRYKQTILGAAWAILQPLMTMLVFLLLFGRFAKMPTNGIPPAMFYYAALVPWVYFATTLGMCSNSLLSNANLLTKVYFPRAILPAAVALSGLLDFAVSTVCLGALLIYYRVMPDWHILLWFPLTLLLVLFTYSLGMILAALAVRYRDVKYATPFVIQLGLFVTPVIYPLNIIPKQYRSFLALNPLTGIIESFRSTLVSSQSVQWDLLGVSVFVTALMFIVGFLYFNRAEQHFADLA